MKTKKKMIRPVLAKEGKAGYISKAQLCEAGNISGSEFDEIAAASGVAVAPEEAGDLPTDNELESLGDAAGRAYFEKAGTGPADGVWVRPDPNGGEDRFHKCIVNVIHFASGYAAGFRAAQEYHRTLRDEVEAMKNPPRPRMPSKKARRAS